jgi:hypothetical protein
MPREAIGARRASSTRRGVLDTMQPRPARRSDAADLRDLGDRSAGRQPGGRRLALGNEGVGEHVRTRFHPGQESAGEIADLKKSAPNEENLFLLPDRFSEERTPRKVDPAV